MVLCGYPTSDIDHMTKKSKLNISNHQPSSRKNDYLHSSKPRPFLTPITLTTITWITHWVITWITRWVITWITRWFCMVCFHMPRTFPSAAIFRQEIKDDSGELEDCHVEPVLQDQCAKSLVKPGEAFLRDNRHIAVDYTIIASDYRNDFETRVGVVNDRPGTLKYVYFVR